MPERRWLNISQAEYHAMDAISSGALRCFALLGPLDYYAQYVAKTATQKITEAKELGSAFHKAMECRDSFDASYLILPAIIGDDEYAAGVNERLKLKGSKAKEAVPGDAINLQLPSHRMYQQCWRDHAAANNKEVLDAAAVERVQRMIDSCYDNVEIAQYLGRGKSETTVVYADEESGFLLKALIDLLPDSSVWLDFKTTSKGSARAFWWDFARLGYDYQFAHYGFTSGITNHKVVAVRSGPDVYEAQLIDVPHELIAGRVDDNRRTLMHLRQLMDDAAGCGVDSQGVPVVFHNEGWGAEIDPREFSEPLETFDA